MLLGLAALVIGCVRSHPMEGQWKGVDAEGKEVVLFLHREGKFEAVARGERVAGTWLVDEEVEPNRIDLNFEGKKVSSIAKVQADNLLIEPVGSDGKLPTSFSKKATYYTRQR